MDVVVNLIKKIFHRHEVYDQKIIEKEIRKIKELDRLLPAMESYYLITNVNTQSYEYASRDFESVTMYTSEDLIAGGLEFLHDKIYSFDLHRIKEAVNALLSYTVSTIEDEDRQNILYNLNYRLRKKDGTSVNILEHVIPIHYNKEGLPVLLFTHCVVVGEGEVKPVLGILKISQEDGAFKTLFSENFTKTYVKNILSNREQEVLLLLEVRASSKEIGIKLGISSHTVDGHRRRILKKLNFHNTAEMVQFLKII